jgi:cytochrome c-type biogenesis protein CcmH/NrfG
LYDKNKKPDKLINILTEALKIDKENVEVLHFLGSAYNESCQYANSKMVYERILKIDAKDKTAKHNLKVLDNLITDRR